MAAANLGRIRWDRLGRVALLVVLMGIVSLYVGPARSWMDAYGEAADRRAQVAKLKAQNVRLRAEKRRLQSPNALEKEARRLGMVRAGERAYVVEGLPGR